jgi:hypothetical protein
MACLNPSDRPSTNERRHRWEIYQRQKPTPPGKWPIRTDQTAVDRIQFFTNLPLEIRLQIYRCVIQSWEWSATLDIVQAKALLPTAQVKHRDPARQTEPLTLPALAIHRPRSTTQRARARQGQYLGIFFACRQMYVYDHPVRIVTDKIYL